MVIRTSRRYRLFDPSAAARRSAVAVAFVLLAMAAPCAIGQMAPAPGLDPDLHVTQYVHSAWTAEDGLPQNAVYAVLQASNGYLWLGTQDGLVRFDGARFEVYNKASGLQSTEIRALLEDAAGSIWIGTNGGGVSRLHNGRFTTYTTADGLASDLVRSLYEDDAGNIWIGTIEGGVSRFDGKHFTTYSTDDGLAGSVVLSIKQHDGAMWFGTAAGLSRLKDGQFATFTAADGLPHDLVWALGRDASGSLWIGTTSGLARLNGSAIESYDTATCGDVVSALHTDKRGTMWLGTLDGGVCRMKNGRFEAYSTDQGLTNERVRAIASDTEGNLWIGTERGGLNRLSGGKFVHLTSAEGLSGDVAFSVMEGRDGTIWIGTEGRGLNLIHTGRPTQITTFDGLPSDHVYALDEAEDGAVWIGMYGGGVCRFDGDETTCYSEESGLTNPDVYAVYADSRGRVWAGTNGGLFVMERGRFGRHGADEGFPDVPVTSILEDARGTIWVGTYGGGLHAIQDQGSEAIDAAGGLSSEIVLVLHEDRGGTIWAGTQGGGLCRIQLRKQARAGAPPAIASNDGVACVSSAEGLHNDNVLQILEDDAGSLWLGTLQGIVRVDLEDLNAVADGASDVLTQTVYDKSDGLKTSETSGGTQPAAWKADDGRLWFATNRGVAVIDPGNIHINGVVPPVHVKRISVEGDAISMSGPIHLPAGSRDVTFGYTGLSFTAPEEVRFQYMLEGYDDGWIDAGTRREAFYTNLAPGSYRFLVKAANNDGVWNEEGAAVGFYLEPFFYQTWWFKWICIAAGVAAAFGAYRLRIRQLKDRERELERVVDERTLALRREKERTEESKRVIEAQAEKLRELDRFKTKFFANVSHEFRTPLTMIVGPLENMLYGLYEPLSGTMRQQVEVMLRNALRLMRLINQLLDLSKLEDGKMKLRAQKRDIVSFVEGVLLSCSSFAERKNIDLHFEAAAEEIVLTYEPDKFEKVFYNLLSNATKFTPEGGRISITVCETEASEKYPSGAVRVCVSDTGRGIPEDQLPYVFDRFHQVDGPNGWDHEGTGIGLALVKEMILLHGGEIDVESRLGAGTVFSITLPKGTSHLSPDQIAGDDFDDEIAAHGGGMSQLATSDFNYMHADEAAPELPDEAKAPTDAPLVLVVDDNKDVREYIASIIGDSYRVVTANDGAQGLEQVHADMPDLILSDVMMPNMDGNAFCRAIKSSDDLKHIPVILLTARATHELKIEGLEVGADDYIPKPFNVHELKVRIKNLLRLRRQERELKLLNDHLEAKVREQVDLMLQERRRYEEDLIESRDRAEASDRLKSNILNNLSHEFRTPLTAILGFSEIIRAEGPKDLHEFTMEIDRGGNRLMRTLDSLLELSKIEADRTAEETELLDANRFTRELVEGFRSRAGSKGLALSFEPEKADVEVELNRSAVRVVVQNLIDNAIKFTEEGEVTVRVERTGDELVVRVRDTGIGMRDEFLPHMYDAFVQESDGYTRSFEGCGLGLTVAKRLIELMGGTIQVETELGAGSDFAVAFPIRVPSEV